MGKLSNEQSDRASLVYSVQQAVPYGITAPRQNFILRAAQIHPVIHLVHRNRQPHTPKRIIFDHELILVIAGRGCLTVAGKHYHFKEHDLLFVPPFVPNSMASVPPVEHIAVHFDLAPAAHPQAKYLRERTPYRVRMPHGLAFPPLLHLPQGDRIEHDFNDLVREFDGTDPASPLTATALLTTILARALRLASAQQPVALMRNRERVERVVQFIDMNLHRAPSAKELATVAGISTSRLHTVFRSLVDYSPHDYMLRRRVREARRLLGERDIPIKEIASRLGFDNVHHFSAVFRRIEGVPPARYREESRDAGDETIL